MRTAVIVLGHGSRQEDASGPLAALTADLRSKGPYAAVEHAFLQYAPPSFADVVDRCVRGGADRIVIVPFFVLPGNHVVRDIPEQVKNLALRFPSVQFSITGHVGGHSKMAEIVEDLIEKSE